MSESQDYNTGGVVEVDLCATNGVLPGTDGKEHNFGSDFRALKFVKSKWTRFVLAQKKLIGVQGHKIPRKGFRACLAPEDKWPERDPEACPGCRAGLTVRAAYGCNVLVYEDLHPETVEPKKALSELGFKFYFWRISDDRLPSIQAIFNQKINGQAIPITQLDLKAKCKPNKDEDYQDYDLQPVLGTALYLQDEELKKRVAAMFQADKGVGGPYDVEELMKRRPTKEEWEEWLAEAGISLSSPPPKATKSTAEEAFGTEKSMTPQGSDAPVEGALGD